MGVIVAFYVAAPVSVAALLNGSAIVWIDIVRRLGSMSFVQVARPVAQGRLRVVFSCGIDHGHGMVPVPERGHYHGLRAPPPQCSTHGLSVRS